MGDSSGLGRLRAWRQRSGPLAAGESVVILQVELALDGVPQPPDAFLDLWWGHAGKVQAHGVLAPVIGIEDVARDESDLLFEGDLKESLGVYLLG